MKKWSHLFMAMCVATVFSACSDDVDLSVNNGGGTEESASQVFMQFNLELPTVSRSTTTSDDNDEYVSSDAGVEIGQNYENQVSEVLVVITDATEGDTYDDFIAKSKVTNLTNNTTYVIPFKTTELTAYVNKSVNVYVYCNPTEELTKEGENVDVHKICTINDASNATIWTNNKFLMTNADDDYELTLPANLDDYRVETNPYNLGTINVERAAARFDYKSSVTNETYTLMEDEDGDPEVTITLTDMALVNLSKEFYYLRRVSADGTSTNATIGGTETNTNYVVDTDFKWKGLYSEETTDETNHFFYVYNPNSASTTNDYAWTSISSLTNHDDDNNDSWNTNNSKGDYKIWRYATENTIPAQVSNQKKGITTGVVFKGEINAAEGSAIKKVMDAGNAVYVFDNILWGAWSDVENAAKATEAGSTTLLNPSLAAAYNEATKDGHTDAKAVAAGFTIFRKNTAGKYEVLYYYWNRHNDNGNNGSMGPMEFAVVRNNVYKLSVTGVDKFGHPTNPDDDPNPENPEDPDEEGNVYFRVAVQVLPWVVRINDIEF